MADDFADFSRSNGEKFKNSKTIVSTTDIGVNATGDAGDTSPAIFGQPGMGYVISP